MAGSWFLTLTEPTKSDLAQLKAAFKDRFTSGPQNWILSQQLSSRKQKSDESLDDYATDITRQCKRLGLSDANSMRYFVEWLKGDLQAYVALQRPKTLQEAESYARMKHTVNKCQGLSDNSTLTQVTSLLTRLSDKLAHSPSSQSVAAIASSPPPAEDKRYEILTQQIKQLQQQQRRMQIANTVAAYDSPQGGPQRFPNPNWQPQSDRQIDQLQREVARLDNDLRRYQNPRRPDYRSFGRNFRSVEGDPICSFCNRVGHSWRTCRQRNRDPRLPPANTNAPPQRAIGGPPNFRQTTSQGNA